MSRGDDLTILPLDKIRTDGGTQMRVELDQDYVNDLSEWLTDHPGQDLPPPDVFSDGDAFWLADGFHRERAYAEAEPPRRHIPCRVHAGTLRDAILFAAGANAAHGLKRSSADKRKAVETLLRDKEWSAWSNAKIARQCGVSDMLVADVREAIFKNLEDARKVERGGTTYTMNTARIGGASDDDPDDDEADLDRDERWAREQEAEATAQRPEPAEVEDEAGAGGGMPALPDDAPGPWGRGPMPPLPDERDRLTLRRKLRRALRKVFKYARTLRMGRQKVHETLDGVFDEEAGERQRAG